jgi:hypothetical protein
VSNLHATDTQAHTFQYSSSASVVFFIASLFYTFMTSFHQKIPLQDFFPRGVSELMVYKIGNCGLFGMKGIATLDGLGFS